MKIILLGYGKMGHEVELVALQRGHEIIARIDNSSELENLKISDSKETVAIEFSTPTTALENIKRCFDMNIPVVCGTTGWYKHLDDIKERCEKENQALFYAPNFSIGMNIMFLLNKQLARLCENYNYRLSLSETHHIHKLDKPSGTAVKLAEDIIDNNNDYNSWKCDEECIIKEDVLTIEAIREGEVFGIHEVKAESDCDIIQLRHKAFSRKGFATGAVIAAEFILKKTGIYTMNDLLKQ